MPGVELHFEINTICHLNCLHCSSSSRSISRHELLAPGKISSFLKSFPHGMTACVCITGGEPLLADGFFEILETLAGFPNVDKVGIFTSGCTLLGSNGPAHIDDSTARALRKSGVSFCYVSLYSSCQEKHDFVTGTVGSQRAAVRTLRNLRKNGVDTRVHFVPMKCNRNEVLPLLDFLVGEGVTETRFLRLVKHGRAEKNWEQIGLSADEQIEVVRGVVDGVHRFPGMRLTVAGFPQYWDCRPFFNSKGCQAAIRLYYIDVAGNIFPCASKKRDASFVLGRIDEAGDVVILNEPDCLSGPYCLQDNQHVFLSKVDI